MGLFSRKQYADTIFVNATVETLDPDYPDAEAIAVKDGAVLALGDREDVEAFVNRDTETVDLDGACVVPGFFTMNGTLIRDAYASFGLPLSEKAGEESVLRSVRAYVGGHPKMPAYFAFGYSDLLSFDGASSGADGSPALPRDLLDKIEPKKPLVLLSASGSAAVVNSAALSAAHSALEEELKAMEAAGDAKPVPQGRSSAADAVLRTKTDEGIDLDGEYDDEIDPAEALAGEEDLADTEAALEKARALNPWFLFRDILPGYQYFDRDEAGVPTGRLEGPSTISQFMNILGSFDEEALARSVVNASIAYAKKGYTALLDSGSPDYLVRGFMSVATDLLQNGLALQRNVIPTFVPKETDTYLALQRMNQRETLCVECGDLLAASAVRFEAHTTPDGEPTLSAEFLEEYAASALDHGFDVLACCDGPAAANAALEGLGAARDKARKGKLVVRLSGLSDEEENELRDGFDTAGIPVIGEPKTPAQILSVLTGRQRHLLRAYEDSGRIAVGAPADFAVLDRSPFANADEDGNGAEDPAAIPVRFTVLGGRIVSTDAADYALPSFDDFGEDAFEDFEE